MSAPWAKRTPVPTGVVAGSVAALGTLVPVALYQLGAVKHLPDPPLEFFDSETLTMSRMAHPLGVPDSLPGLASYSTTLMLALLAGRSERARRLLAWKLVGDGAFAVFNTARSVRRFGRLCSWCTGTALCTTVMVVAGRHLIAEEGRRLEG